jgi:hypothetical protein
MRTLLLLILVGTFVSGALAQSLSQQAQCAAQARVTAREDNNKWELENKQVGLPYRTVSFDYQSHYNAKMNRCFLMTTRTMMFGDKIYTLKNLSDAFERRDYALFTSGNPQFCQLLPSIGQEKCCTTQEEFDAFVAGYMEE